MKGTGRYSLIIYSSLKKIPGTSDLYVSSIASLQSDLAQANAERASLDEELASARLAMERHQRQAKHEANRLNSEVKIYCKTGNLFNYRKLQVAFAVETLDP